MESSGKHHGAPVLRPEQLAKALSHPIRRQILYHLAGGPRSQAVVSRSMGRPARDLSYHFKVLVRDCEILEPVNEEPRPSGGQRFRIRTPLRLASLELEMLPDALGSAVVARLIQTFLALVVGASNAGSITAREGTTLSARLGVLDRAGWKQANSVLRSADEEVEMIEAESRERLKASGETAAIHVALGIALFETARAENLPHQSAEGDR